jgi:hypothetical protein
VQLGGTVGDPQGLRGDHHLDERHLVGDPQRAVQVQGALHDIMQHLRHRN